MNNPFKRLIKSRNTRMFMVCGVVLIVMMMMFFGIKDEPKGMGEYLSFGFVWLSLIINVCCFYLVPRKTQKSRNAFNALLFIYFFLCLLFNVAFSYRMRLHTAIAVNFVLVLIALGGGIFFYLMGNTNEN